MTTLGAESRNNKIILRYHFFPHRYVSYRGSAGLVWFSDTLALYFIPSLILWSIAFISYISRNVKQRQEQHLRQTSTNTRFTATIDQQHIHGNHRPTQHSRQSSTNTKFMTAIDQHNIHGRHQPRQHSRQQSTNTTLTIIVNHMKINILNNRLTLN